MVHSVVRKKDASGGAALASPCSVFYHFRYSSFKGSKEKGSIDEILLNVRDFGNTSVSARMKAYQLTTCS